MEHTRSQPVQVEQEGIKIEGDVENQEEDPNESQVDRHSAVESSRELIETIHFRQNHLDDSNDQSIELRPQNVIISNSSVSEVKIRPQDGSEDAANSTAARDSSVLQIE